MKCPQIYTCNWTILFEKTFALKYRRYVGFICMDDKHTCKVGEPEFPVAAVECGKEVIVSIYRIIVLLGYEVFIVIAYLNVYECFRKDKIQFKIQ